jgi:hypothetical protein
MAETLLEMTCGKCAGLIEFEDKLKFSTAKCPHCQHVILLSTDSLISSEAPPSLNYTIPNPKNYGLLKKTVIHLIGGTFIAGLIIAVGFLVVGILRVPPAPDYGPRPVSRPQVPNLDISRTYEYYEAKKYIQAQYPGAQSFSSCDDSTVQASENGDCIVIINVNGVNGFNAPIHDTMTVIMKYVNGSFIWVRTESAIERKQVFDSISDPQY